MGVYENFDISIILILTLVFFIAGFVDSIAGGGGLISMPSLLLAGLPPQYALGTNKFVVVFGTATALFNFVKHKKIIYKITLLGIGFSLVGAYFGTKLILLFQEKTIASIMLFLLPVAALSIFIPKKSLKNTPESFSLKATFIYTPILSFVIGAYDGFFGPGTGTFLIIGFYLFLHMDMLQSSATAKAINLASGVGSLAAFSLSGNVLYKLALPLIAGNILGGYLGSKLVLRRGAGVVRLFVIISFLILFVSLIWKYFSIFE